MVIREKTTINGMEAIRNYSDEGKYIERDGNLYTEACDMMPWAEDRFYTETEIPIELN